jgi:hypothetical protein
MLKDIGGRGAVTSGVRFWICGAVEQRCDRFPVGPQMVNFTDLVIMGLFEFLVMCCNVRCDFLGTTDRARRLQAQWWNVRVDFALPKRIALRIATGFVRYAGIRIHKRRKQVECDLILLFLFLHERLHVPLPENRCLQPRIGPRATGSCLS